MLSRKSIVTRSISYVLVVLLLDLVPSPWVYFPRSSEAYAQVVTSLNQELPKGWNLVCVPLTPTNPSPASVFEELTGKLHLYAYRDGKYLGPTENFPNIAPGEAYWLLLEQKLAIAAAGQMVSTGTSFRRQLVQGWNFFASPWPTPVDWTDSRISFSDGSSTVSLGNAINQGWIRAQAFGFDPGSNLFQPLTANAPIPAQLMPWRGYVLFANRNSEIIFSAPQADPSPPQVALSAPAADSDLLGPIGVIGTARDSDLVQYRLEYAFAGSNQFTTFAIGNASVVDATLGIFDPTQLLNGLYQIRLVATDLSGLSSQATVNVSVSGDQKIGNFSLAFNDLVVPLVGLPIEIVRTYDTRDKRVGDFGVGWRLSLNDIRLEEKRALGLGWQGIQTGSGLNLRRCIIPLLQNEITVTVPGGEKFRFEPTVDALDLGTNCAQSIQGSPDWGTVKLRPTAGTRGTLTILDGASFFLNTVQFAVGPLTLLTQEDFSLLDPDLYRFTREDGLAIDISQENGVQKITDPGGNTITINRNGIIHSAGKSVTFERDAQGRIIRMTDPMGHQLQYEYDSRGDLVRFTDQGGNVTTFAYNLRHDLIEMRDPLGRPVQRNEYDDDGRLVAVTDASGRRISVTHAIGDRQEVITDRLGRVTVYGYDERGNVTSVTNGLGQTTTYTYDERGNELSSTNPLGQTTYKSYDASGNVLAVTDALGNVTRYTYNSRGQRLSRTDALGRRYEYTYAPDGNQLTEKDPLGNTTVYTYDDRGNRATATDPLGNVTRYAYDREGNIIAETDPLGHRVEKFYDSNNRLVRQTARRTVNGASEELTTLYHYDSLGRMISMVSPGGATKSFTYSPTGKKTSETDALGNITTYQYDTLDRLVATRYPDGTSRTIQYDAEGQKIAETDQAGRTTRYTYDAAGRLVITEYPDGSRTQNTYDAAGRKIAETDENGHTTTYEYDAEGRNTSITDPLGGVTRFEYDAVGNVVSRTDRNGNTTSYEFNELNVQVRAFLPDGHITSATYDARSLRTAFSDAAGNTTRYEYDALGRLVKVIDALGGQTRYGYDAVGNRISITDANDSTRLFTYDRDRNEIARTLPLGQVRSATYDLANRPIEVLDFNDQLTRFRYDAMGRLTEKILPDGATVAFTYTPTGETETITDAQGVTRFTYDLRDRPIRIEYPDGSELLYTYDAKGNRTSLTTPDGTTAYTYDAGDRLIAIEDPQGRQTTFTYDAQGNRTGVQYPNGITTEYTYDTMNRLTNITHRSGDTVLRAYAYTLGPAGNRIRVHEDTGRTVDYTYDALYRLTEETVSGGATNYTASYQYDAVGNRISLLKDAELTAYLYDANHRMLSAGEMTFEYDDNGNLIASNWGGQTTTYQYDGLNRLVSMVAPGGATAEYVYDGMDHRISQSNSQETVRYLVDPFALSDVPEVVRESDGQGQRIASYIHGHSLVSMERTGGVSFFLHDGQMSTRLLADGSGAITDAYDYNAFGNLIDHLGTTPNHFLFNGQQLDPNLGFYYLRARYYDPNIGRFLGIDPFDGMIFDPLSLHPYTYAHNDPVNRSDPTGKFEFSIGLAAASAVVGVLAGLGTYALTGNIWAAVGVGLLFAAAAFFLLPVIAPATFGGGQAAAASAAAAAEAEALAIANSARQALAELVKIVARRGDLAPKVAEIAARGTEGIKILQKISLFACGGAIGISLLEGQMRLEICNFLRGQGF